jgi:hypothetical protein
MRILILNTDYPDFLTSHYAQNPSLKEASYQSQMEARNQSLFGSADFYSYNLNALGHEVVEVHVNNLFLQQKWVAEFAPDLKVDWPHPPSFVKKCVTRVKNYVDRRLKIPPWQVQVLTRQMADFAPQVVWNQALDGIPTSVMKSLKKDIPFLMGQLAAPIPKSQDFRVYDLMISSLPNLVSYFEKLGVPALHSHLAFDPRILPQVPAVERDIPFLFVGSITMQHPDRIALLEALSRETPLEIWGIISSDLPKSSPIWECYKGQAWGIQMYQLLRRARITLNSHINIAENYANNMRLFEATGCGTLLLTDAKENLETLFVIDQEVVAYKSVADCLEKVIFYQKNPSVAQRIAHKGQERTLGDHTYRKRLGELWTLLAQKGHVPAPLAQKEYLSSPPKWGRPFVSEKQENLHE